MKSFLIRHFPANRSRFMMYLKVFLPIIAGSTLYALNGVVDNFMVGKVEQGVSALSVVNLWGYMITGFFIGIAAAGSVVMAQFFHAKQYDKAKEISRYRFFFCFIVTIPFFIIAWTNPDILIGVFYKKSNDAHADALLYENARDYMKIIAFQWLLFSFTFNFGNQLRELGHGKQTMYWGVGTLSINILFNSILMYVLNMGVQGAAVASVMGRVVAFLWGAIFVMKKKLPVSYNLFKIHHTSKRMQKMFWQRWTYFFSVFTVYIFVALRSFFYAKGYPTGSLGEGVSGPSVLGLTGALMNIFTTTFAALASMAAFFVASELGKNNLKQAKINSDELKGFNTIMAFMSSIVLALFAIAIPYMTFLSKDQYENGKHTFDSTSQLLNVRNSLFVIAAFYPMWIWFSTSFRNGNAGGKGWKFSLTDWIISGPIQLGWSAIIAFVIVPSSTTIAGNFAMAYAIFFTSDILKLIFQEIFYYADHSWLHSLTKEDSKIDMIAAKEINNNSPR